MTNWNERAVHLAKLVKDLLEIVETGPCCGLQDEGGSHYHCAKCGSVGGMYHHVGDDPNCKPNVEYQRKYKLPSLVREACEEILETGTGASKALDWEPEH